MAKELEYIGSITSVGDLPQKMEEAEEAKTEVEAIILERVSNSSGIFIKTTALFYYHSLFYSFCLFFRMLCC